jgi:hypothetical protein
MLTSARLAHVVVGDSAEADDAPVIPVMTERSIAIASSMGVRRSNKRADAPARREGTCIPVPFDTFEERLLPKRELLNHK